MHSMSEQVTLLLEEETCCMNSFELVLFHDIIIAKRFDLHMLKNCSTYPDCPICAGGVIRNGEKQPEL